MEISKQIKMQALSDAGFNLVLIKNTEKYDDGEPDEIIYSIELDNNKGTKIFLLETYQKDTAELLFILLRENITNYIDLSKVAKNDKGYYLLAKK